MSLKIIHIPLETKARQVISVPEFAKFLSADLDQRFNTPAIWVLAEDSADHKKEKVEILVLEHDHELRPATAKFVGSYKSNSGAKFVFASRPGDHPFTKIPHE